MNVRIFFQYLGPRIRGALDRRYSNSVLHLLNPTESKSGFRFRYRYLSAPFANPNPDSVNGARCKI